jgi:hypothetical protein
MTRVTHGADRLPYFEENARSNITLLPDTLRPLIVGIEFSVLYGVASVKERRDGVRHSDVHEPEE